MTLISKGSVATLDFQLKDDEGQRLDSSEENGPMIFIQGSEDILQPIEDAVEGLSIGDEVSVTIRPEQSYGEYDASLVTTVPMATFEGIDNLFPGMKLQEETPNGPVVVTIKEITDDKVIVDANHPLAGQSLHFELKVKAIRLATAEELDHGHVHSDQGHCH